MLNHWRSVSGYGMAHVLSGNEERIGVDWCVHLGYSRNITMSITFARALWSPIEDRFFFIWYEYARGNSFYVCLETRSHLWPRMKEIGLPGIQPWPCSIRLSLITCFERCILWVSLPKQCIRKVGWETIP